MITRKFVAKIQIILSSLLLFTFFLQVNLYFQIKKIQSLSFEEIFNKVVLTQNQVRNLSILLLTSFVFLLVIIVSEDTCLRI